MEKRIKDLPLHGAKPHRTVFISNLRNYIIILLTPLAFSIVFYFISVNQAQEYAIQLNRNVLLTASETINLRLQEVHNVANEVISQNSVLYYQSLSYGFDYPHVYRMIEMRNSLSNYKLTQHFISDFFIFFNKSHTVINKNLIYQYDDFFKNYFLVSEVDGGELMRSITENTLQTGLLPVRDITLYKTAGSYLVYTQPLMGSDNGYIMILINRDLITSLFENIDFGNDGAIYILGSQNRTLMRFALSSTDADALVGVISEHLANGVEASSFQIDTDKGLMLVNQLHANALNCITVQPLNVILSRVHVYRMVIFISLIVAMLFGVLLCLWQARRISVPISDILREIGIEPRDSGEVFSDIRQMVVTLRDSNENLYRIASEHQMLLRSSFTSRLLHGDFANDAEAARVSEYVLPGCASFSTACVVLLRLGSRYEEQSDAVNLKLLASLKVTLKDAIDRCESKPLYYDVDEETLAWVLFDLSKEAADALYARLRASLPTRLLGELYAFGGGMVTPPLQRISRSYEEAHTAMIAQLLSLDNTADVIAWADSPHSRLAIFFPTDLRNRLTEAVRQGDGELAERLLEELFHVNCCEHPLPYPLQGLFISEMLATALDCLPSLHKSISDENVLEMLDDINKAEPPKQRHLLREFYTMLANSTRDGQSNGRQQVILKVTEYLKEKYAYSELTLSDVADHFGLNASSLSTAFKQYTGKTLSAYLEELRIQRAQYLLRTTNLSITQIAEQVGYPSSNTFCRAYRRNTGSNTSTYRRENVPGS